MRMQHPISLKTNTGVTLIEVLIVILILSIVCIMFIHAIMLARKSVRRVSCENNLSQIGIALNSYLSLYNDVMPAPPNGYSVHVILLPMLDRLVLYNAFNFSQQYVPTPRYRLSSTISRSLVGTFGCPSDSEFGVTGNVNYACNTGTGLISYGMNGVFTYGRWSKAISVASITDGTSNTVAMSEWLVGTSNRARDPKRTVFMTKVNAKMTAESLAQDCHELDIWVAPKCGSKGMSWIAHQM